jgi:hypothetical protein
MQIEGKEKKKAIQVKGIFLPYANFNCRYTPEWGGYQKLHQTPEGHQVGYQS